MIYFLLAVAACLVMLFPAQNFTDRVAAAVNRQSEHLVFDPGRVAGFSLPITVKYEGGKLVWTDTVTFSPESLSIGIRPASLFSPAKDVVFRGQQGQTVIKGEIRAVSPAGGTGYTLEIQHLPVKELKRRIGGSDTGLAFSLSARMAKDGDKISGQASLEGITADLKNHPKLSRAGIDEIRFDQLDLAFSAEGEKMTISACKGTGPWFTVSVTGSVDLGPKGTISLEGELNPTPSMVSKLSRVADVQHLFAASGKAAGIPVKISGSLNDARVRFR